MSSYLLLKDYLGEIFQLSKYRIKKNQNRMFWNKKNIKRKFSKQTTA